MNIEEIIGISPIQIKTQKLEEIFKQAGYRAKLGSRIKSHWYVEVISETDPMEAIYINAHLCTPKDLVAEDLKGNPLVSLSKVPKRFKPLKFDSNGIVSKILFKPRKEYTRKTWVKNQIELFG